MMGRPVLTSDLLMMMMMLVMMVSHLEAERLPQELVSSVSVDQRNFRRFPVFRTRDSLFIAGRLHQLVDASVPSIGNQPWLNKSQLFVENKGGMRHKLTAIVVDDGAGRDGNDTVLFIGTEAGIVLTVLVSLNDSVLLDEIDVFSQSKCFSGKEDDRKIISLRLEKDTHTLFVGFSGCVVTLPLSHCERHESCQKCVGSRDPYCGWTSHGGCERIDAIVRAENEQKVKNGVLSDISDCHAADQRKVNPEWTWSDVAIVLLLSSQAIAWVLVCVMMMLRDAVLHSG